MAVIQPQLAPDQRTFLRGKKRGQTGTFRAKPARYREIQGEEMSFNNSFNDAHLKPHHDGSELYVSNRAPHLGEKITLRIRIPKRDEVEKVLMFK